MAQIRDRKRDFYSQKQSVRDESSAPTYLESAGDVLLKRLSKKQLETSTTLEDQLNLTQNFQKSFDLNPIYKTGVTTFQELWEELKDEERYDCQSSFKGSSSRNLNQLLRDAGLSRHEVELTLCEKPNSDISKLYAFALGNKKEEKGKGESAERLLPDHPIHHLPKIHDEFFGHLKRVNKRFAEEKECIESSENVKEGVDKVLAEESTLEVRRKKVKKKRRRKRKIKRCSHNEEKASVPSTSSDHKTDFTSRDELVNEMRPKITRPSLWDVKDMRKWCEPKKEYGCKPQTLYTIKEGKIIKYEGIETKNADEKPVPSMENGKD